MTYDLWCGARVLFARREPPFHLAISVAKANIVYGEVMERQSLPRELARPSFDSNERSPSTFDLQRQSFGCSLFAGVYGIAGASLVGCDAPSLMTSLGASGAGPMVKFMVGFPLIYHYLGAVRHTVSCQSAGAWLNVLSKRHNTTYLRITLTCNLSFSLACGASPVRRCRRAPVQEARAPSATVQAMNAYCARVCVTSCMD